MDICLPDPPRDEWLQHLANYARNAEIPKVRTLNHRVRMGRIGYPDFRVVLRDVHGLDMDSTWIVEMFPECNGDYTVLVTDDLRVIEATWDASSVFQPVSGGPVYRGSFVEWDEFATDDTPNVSKVFRTFIDQVSVEDTWCHEAHLADTPALITATCSCGWTCALEVALYDDRDGARRGLMWALDLHAEDITIV